ncbi:PA2817 family protein [Aestuariirhabdus litorea]|uniref:Dehydrogenase n=1 Tax=Aestuariirhabdus litorea TaxID=2528527 RepID=A0A3P3VS96_9GAMM|nr:PA2817 family protein [Aestuariirhabdus litorea]RRJ84566.1 dehydrogenase [Aestuariirhabdus litorea]RWW97792.1 dehydrogenase [Endozoicomonadaceae bacterium GTF-13]
MASPTTTDSVSIAMAAFSLPRLRFELLQQLQQQLRQLVESGTMPEFSDNPLLAKLEQLLPELEQGEESALFDAQQSISLLIANFPQLTPLVSRDLLWLLGGDCLHWMPEAEVELYQQLEELYHQALEKGNDFDWVATRQQLTTQPQGLH